MSTLRVNLERGHIGFPPVRRTGFPAWLCRKKILQEDSPVGDLANDWVSKSSQTSPSSGYKPEPFLQHLDLRGACFEAKVAFVSAYMRFRRERGGPLKRKEIVSLLSVYDSFKDEYDDEDGQPPVEGREQREQLLAMLACANEGGLEQYGNNQVSPRLRFRIFHRDGFCCQYCGQRAPDVTLHVDHIRPRSKGGSNDPGNLITSCAECNVGKSDLLYRIVLSDEEEGLIQ